jgi:hypothetical protein
MVSGLRRVLNTGLGFRKYRETGSWPVDDNQNVTNSIEAKPEAAGARRQFLDAAGRIALAAPPAITLLLASGGSRPAWASGGGNGNAYGHDKVKVKDK